VGAKNIQSADPRLYPCLGAPAFPRAPHPFALARRAFAFLIRLSQKLRAIQGRSFWRFLETTGRFLKKLKILIEGGSEERIKSTGLGARR
jgi:hypothetical protein